MATSSDAAESLSGSCRNLLDPEDFYFNTSTGTWQTTNGTSSVDFSFRFKNQYHTLKATPSSSSQVTLQHGQIQLPSLYKNDFITFYGHIYCESKVTVTVTVTSSYGDSSSVTTVLNALTWGIVRGPEIQVPPTEGNTGFTTTIQIVNHNNSAIYLAHPVLTNTYAIRNNLFLRMCMERMPVFFIEKDSEQTAPNFPMLRLMDVGLAYAGKAVDELDSFPYLDIASGYDATDNSTKSSLVEPQVANKEFLPWLAQIVGTKLSQSAGGSTPWGNLPTTWASFVSLIDTGDANATADWEEIETYNTSDNNFVQGRRDQITTARIGHNAGTKTAIIDSTETVLTGTKTVNYIVDPIANPWTITLETLTSETPGGVHDEDSETVINAVEKSRPMGFTIQHICTDSFTPITYFEVAPASQEVTRLWSEDSFGTGANSTVNAIAFQSDGKIVIGGFFSSWNGTTVGRIVRLNSDGARDTAFSNNIGTGGNSEPLAIAIQSDGKIVIGGFFTSWNGTTGLGRIVRLNSDGTRDTAFTTNTGTGGISVVRSIAIQSDGKIVVGGQFISWNGTTVNRIVRLNSDGTRDTAFTTNTGTGANSTVNAIAVQSDGKILLGGDFTSWNGVTVNTIVRLNSDGTRDTAFTTNVGTGTNGIIISLVIQSDGKIVVGGNFDSWNGTTVGYIVRLNSDGTRDTAFTTNNGTGGDSVVRTIAIQSDGKIVVSGDFTSWNGVTVNTIVRLNSDGTRDTAFTTNVGTGGNDYVFSTAVQSDGKILVGGEFTSWNGTTVGRIVRLNDNGSVQGQTDADATAIGTGAQNTIDIIADTGGVAATNASAYCADLVYGGYSDWFLPSKDELAQLRIQRDAIGDLQTAEYWTSTEYLNGWGMAWAQRIDTGVQASRNKSSQTAYVRPVRSFSGYRAYAIGSTGPAGGKIFIVQP